MELQDVVELLLGNMSRIFFRFWNIFQFRMPNYFHSSNSITAVGRVMYWQWLMNQQQSTEFVLAITLCKNIKGHYSELFSLWERLLFL